MDRGPGVPGGGVTPPGHTGETGFPGSSGPGLTGGVISFPATKPT
ncbi:hypothetical protein LACDD01_00072 [Lactococcus sp. DD01]|nr:hypothetical protein LACDD01_00072 [Lactococcus sp. DD01]